MFRNTSGNDAFLDLPGAVLTKKHELPPLRDGREDGEGWLRLWNGVSTRRESGKLSDGLTVCPPCGLLTAARRQAADVTYQKPFVGHVIRLAVWEAVWLRSARVH